MRGLELDVVERIWNKVIIDPVSGCWNFTGASTKEGYGRIHLDGRLQLPHRVMYEKLIGPIPNGLELDHSCRNPSCCNPEHLEPVTPQVNQLRGNTVSSRNALVTCCPKGHPYDKENTRVRPDGSRNCKECDRESARKRYWKKKAMVEMEASIPSISSEGNHLGSGSDPESPQVRH